MALIYPTLSGLLVRMAASLQRLRSFRRPLTISVFMNPMGQRYGMERADGKRFRGMWSKARHFWHVFGVLSTFHDQRTVLINKGASRFCGQTNMKLMGTALFRRYEKCAIVRICAQSSHLS